MRAKSNVRAGTLFSLVAPVSFDADRAHHRIQHSRDYRRTQNVALIPPFSRSGLG